MKLKKLRKIYRILFPLKISEEKLFEINLKSNRNIKEFKKVEKLFEITLLNNQKLFLRDYKHSDYDVFQQIFNFEEYKLLLSILTNNPKNVNEETVLIDAGSNVGYTTMYFSLFFNFNKIYCIEPSKENISILEKNIKSLKNFDNITLFLRALTNNKNAKFSLDTNFRDNKDWSIATSENQFGDIKGITINEIIDENDLKEITLLKIDIEGAERFIFNQSNDLGFLKMVKLVAIEIHDEFNIRNEIYQILIENNFTIFESGELTIGINKAFF